MSGGGRSLSALKRGRRELSSRHGAFLNLILVIRDCGWRCGGGGWRSCFPPSACYILLNRSHLAHMHLIIPCPTPPTQHPPMCPMQVGGQQRTGVGRRCANAVPDARARKVPALGAAGPGVFPQVPCAQKGRPRGESVVTNHCFCMAARALRAAVTWASMLSRMLLHGASRLSLCACALTHAPPLPTSIAGGGR